MATQGKQASRRIVVVGGGMSGISIAVRLAQSGLPVTVLEASRLGQGASTRTQGWLYSGAWFAQRHPKLAQLCHESLQQAIRFCPKCLEPATPPMIYVITSADTIPSDWTTAWNRAGIPFEEVAIASAAEETGIASSLVRHAFRLPDRAIQTKILLERLTAQAQHCGAEIRTESLVTALTIDGTRVEGVVTSTGEKIAARLVILAANAGLGGLLPDAPRAGEQSEFTRVGLKTHCLAIAPPLGSTPYCVVDREGFNHIPHGSVSVFGSGRWIPVAEGDSERTIPTEIERLWAHVAFAHPNCRREARHVVEWAGVAVQAMHADQVEPGAAPIPTVIDHKREPPGLSNLLSVFPGRASLWPALADATRRAVLEKLQNGRPAIEGDLCSRRTHAGPV